MVPHSNIVQGFNRKPANSLNRKLNYHTVGYFQQPKYFVFDFSRVLIFIMQSHGENNFLFKIIPYINYIAVKTYACSFVIVEQSGTTFTFVLMAEGARSISSCILGYHTFKEIWNLSNGDKLNCLALSASCPLETGNYLKYFSTNILTLSHSYTCVILCTG